MTTVITCMSTRRGLMLLIALLLGASTLLSGTAAGSRAKAVRFVKGHGYTPVKKSQYRPEQRLRVLVGRKVFGCCRVGRKAFFFVRRRGFQRTDVRKASFTGVRVKWQRDKTIALQYGPLYKRNDPSCCPSGGKKLVRFRWNGTRVRALDPIPPLRKRRSGY